MKIPETEAADLRLTSDMESYAGMSLAEIFIAAVRDWPPQMAVLLIEFFAKDRCQKCGEIVDLYELPRPEGKGGNFIAAMCKCELAQMHLTDDTQG